MNTILGSSKAIAAFILTTVLTAWPSLGITADTTLQQTLEIIIRATLNGLITGAGVWFISNKKVK